MRMEGWYAVQYHCLLHWHLMPEHQPHPDMSLLIALFGGSGCTASMPVLRVPMHQQYTPGKAFQS